MVTVLLTAIYVCCTNNVHIAYIMYILCIIVCINCVYKLGVFIVYIQYLVYCRLCIQDIVYIILTELVPLLSIESKSGIYNLPIIKIYLLIPFTSSVIVFFMATIFKF